MPSDLIPVAHAGVGISAGLQVGSWDIVKSRLKTRITMNSANNGRKANKH